MSKSLTERVAEALPCINHYYCTVGSGHDVTCHADSRHAVLALCRELVESVYINCLCICMTDTHISDKINRMDEQRKQGKLGP